MLLGSCYAVARMFWVVTRVLYLVARRLIKCTEWLHVAFLVTKMF